MKKIAYTLLQKKYANLQPGDKVALVFPNSEPINFMCTLYGCLLAQIVPVVVEVPMSSNVSCRNFLIEINKLKKKLK